MTLADLTVAASRLLSGSTADHVLFTVSAGNVLRYFGQILIVVAMAELGVRLLRRSAARVRLVYWRLVIVLCLLLPLVPVRAVEPLAATASDQIDVQLTNVSALASSLALALWQATGSALLRTVLPLVPWLLLGGALGRAAWLGLGFVRLRRLRRRCDPRDAAGDDSAALPIDMRALIHALAPHATVRWHDEIAQPLTFGLRRPIVLLPRRVADLPIDAQRAIVCHELLHVAGRDWAWILVEEAIQTACWWHPAMWWALAQVQLHREETIDERVVALTGARRPYMRALLLFAEALPAPAPAIPFIRRRHLTARLRQLSQEASMSRLQLTSALTVLTLTLAGASWASLSALPLRTHAAAPAPAATPDKPIKATDKVKPRVIAEVKPTYPKDALASKAQGEVELELHVTRTGAVSDVRVVTSIPMLDQAAIDAARQWKFEPARLNGKPVDVLCNVTMRFTLK
jgi:TonB family protein